MRIANKSLVVITILIPTFTSLVAAKTEAKKSSNAQAKAASMSCQSDQSVTADEYQSKISQLMHENKFTEIDCLATSDRINKTRFPGGIWKLHVLYEALSAPQNGEDSPDDQWQAYFKQLQAWIAHSPDSITPHVALAKAYISDGWQARGTNSSDQVTNTGWKLFADRLMQAKSTLDEAQSLKQKCPEWFTAMQGVALGQSWDKAKATTLFNQAIAFEPQYQYFYADFANYLLPSWNGKVGDISAFADRIADANEGKTGRILYYFIAAAVVCCADQDTVDSLSWLRIQQGYIDLVHQYSPSNYRLNQITRISVRYNDGAYASAAFQKIGDNWDKQVWSRQYFDKCKAWAGAPNDGPNQHLTELAQRVQANLNTPEGKAYDEEIAAFFAQTFSDRLKECAQKSPKDMNPANLYLQIATQGSLKQFTIDQSSALVGCILPQLQMSPFPHPPAPDYWVKVSLEVSP